MIRMLVIAFLAIALGGQAAHSDLIPGSSTTVAEWRMGAYDNKGKFSHCAMSAPYRSGITMYFSVSGDYSWRVGWSHEAWRFTKGQSVDLVLYVDNAGPYHLKADAVTESMALAELPAKATVFDLMRRGYRMTVRALGNTYAFNLDGTYAALTEILGCTGRYSGVASAPLTPPAPMVPRTAAITQPAGQVTAEQRLEATKVVANILAQGEMTGFRILSAKEISELDIEYVTKSHVAWRADGILGTLRILTSKKVSLSDMNAAIISDDAKECKGKFASGSVSDEKSPSVLRLFTACDQNGKMYEFRYTIVPVGDGTHYLFATAGLAELGSSRDRVAKVETILRHAVYEVMKQ